MNKELLWKEFDIPTGACALLPFNTFQLTYKLEDGRYMSVVKLPYMPKKFKAYGSTEYEAQQSAARRALVYVD